MRGRNREPIISWIAGSFGAPVCLHLLVGWCGPVFAAPVMLATMLVFLRLRVLVSHGARDRRAL